MILIVVSHHVPSWQKEQGDIWQWRTVSAQACWLYQGYNAVSARPVALGSLPPWFSAGFAQQQSVHRHRPARLSDWINIHRTGHGFSNYVWKWWMRMEIENEEGCEDKKGKEKAQQIQRVASSSTSRHHHLLPPRLVLHPFWLQYAGNGMRGNRFKYIKIKKINQTNKISPPKPIPDQHFYNSSDFSGSLYRKNSSALCSLVPATRFGLFTAKHGNLGQDKSPLSSPVSPH